MSGWSSAHTMVATAANAPDPIVELRQPRRYQLPQWKNLSRCRGMDEEIFFGEHDASGRPALHRHQVAQAARICTDCPVFRACLVAALGSGEDDGERYGVWAGTSGKTRRRIWALLEAGEVTLDQVVADLVVGNTAPYETKVESPTATMHTRTVIELVDFAMASA